MKNIKNFFILKVMRNRGLIFCHVRSSQVFCHLIASSIDGTQKWQGAAPILVINPNSAKVELEKFIVIWRALIMRRDDEAPWTKKYLIAASGPWIFSLLMSSGTNPIRFISNPNQAKNQELALREIRVPITIILKKMVLAGFIIKKGVIPIVRLWA